MSNAFRRGSVVLRGELYGVVWDVRDDALVLLPIMQARSRGRASHRRAHDVDPEFAELLAAAIALPAPAQPADVVVTLHYHPAGGSG